MIHDVRKTRILRLKDEVQKGQAQGVIVCMMKFCDQEEYDFPLLLKAMEEEGIPVLYLEIHRQEGGGEQLRTRIQTFGEMIETISL